MASKRKKAPSKKVTSLEDIEKHLARQDKEMIQSNWLTFAAFGGSVALLGVSLWLGSLANVTVFDYVFLIVFGVAFLIVALQQSSRVVKK